MGDRFTTWDDEKQNDVRGYRGSVSVWEIIIRKVKVITVT